MKNPIHSLFLLILVFTNATGVLLFVNIEFLAMLLLIVYMGAISVLFLFVIMMLNIRLLELKESFWKYSVISFYLVGILILQFLLFVIYNIYSELTNTSLITEINYVTLISISKENMYYMNWAKNFLWLRDIKVLGALLYTYYSFTFIMVGLILLLAMISAITLVLKPILYSKKQLLYKQISRRLLDTIYQIN